MFDATNETGEPRNGQEPCDDGAVLPGLGVFRLRSLLRGNRMCCSMPVTIVSLHEQLCFDSGFGRLASGPVAALYVPPGFRLTLVQADAAPQALALTLAWPSGMTPVHPREVLPARSAIDAESFARLAVLQPFAPRVLPPQAPAVRAVVQWLLRQKTHRNQRCQGHRSARHALRQWSDAITDAESQLVALHPEIPLREFALPHLLRDQVALRRFQTVTGHGPRRYVREFRRRVGAAQARAAESAD